MTPTINLILSTCKLIADVVPGILSVGPTGRDTVPLQILLHVPAFSFIKGVEEQGKLLDVCLLAEVARLADHQWTDQT